MPPGVPSDENLIPPALFGSKKSIQFLYFF